MELQILCAKKGKGSKSFLWECCANSVEVIGLVWLRASCGA